MILRKLSIYLGINILCFSCFWIIDAILDTDSSLTNINKALYDTKTHIFIILSNSTHRARLVDDFLESIDVDRKHVTLIPSIDGSRVPVSRYGDFVRRGWLGNWYWKGLLKEGSKKFPEHHDQSSVRGRWALQMSVIDTMENFLKTDFENMLIFEDDAAISKDLSREKIFETFVYMLRLDKSLWDLQYLGWCWECATSSERNLIGGDISKYKSENGKNHIYMKALFPLCRHAILYSRRTVNWYLKVWRPVHFLGGDEQLVRLVCRYGLKKIRTMEPLFIQSTSHAYKDSKLGNTDTKDTFFEWTNCRRWRKMCMKNTSAVIEFNELSMNPPKNLHTVQSIFENEFKM